MAYAEQPIWWLLGWLIAQTQNHQASRLWTSSRHTNTRDTPPCDPDFASFLRSSPHPLAIFLCALTIVSPLLITNSCFPTLPFSRYSRFRTPLVPKTFLSNLSPHIVIRPSYSFRIQIRPVLSLHSPHRPRPRSSNPQPSSPFVPTAPSLVPAPCPAAPTPTPAGCRAPHRQTVEPSCRLRRRPTPNPPAVPSFAAAPLFDQYASANRRPRALAHPISFDRQIPCSAPRTHRTRPSLHTQASKPDRRVLGVPCLQASVPLAAPSADAAHCTRLRPHPPILDPRPADDRSSQSLFCSTFGS